MRHPAANHPAEGAPPPSAGFCPPPAIAAAPRYAYLSTSFSGIGSAGAAVQPCPHHRHSRKGAGIPGWCPAIVEGGCLLLHAEASRRNPSPSAFAEGLSHRPPPSGPAKGALPPLLWADSPPAFPFPRESPSRKIGSPATLTLPASWIAPADRHGAAALNAEGLPAFHRHRGFVSPPWFFLRHEAPRQRPPTGNFPPGGHLSDQGTRFGSSSKVLLSCKYPY